MAAVDDSAPASLFWHSWQRLVENVLQVSFLQVSFEYILKFWCVLYSSREPKTSIQDFILKPPLKLFKNKAWTIANCAASGNFSDRCGVWWEDVPVEHVEWRESLRGIGISALQPVKGICCVGNCVGWMMDIVVYPNIYIYLLYIDLSVPHHTWNADDQWQGFGSIKHHCDLVWSYRMMRETVRQMEPYMI